MLSPFIVHDKNLFLDRYPANQVTRSLQAWDSADELLINYINEQQLVKKDHQILVFNDNFGALTLSFANNHVTSVTDSFVAECGVRFNAEQNNIASEQFNQINSLDALPEQIDLILYKIPKSKNLLVEQLQQLRKKFGENTTFIAADKAKNIHTNTLKYFERYLGTTTTSLAVKKSRLVFSTLNAASTTSSLPSIKRWNIEQSTFTIANYANVFAHDKLDIGARFFLANLPNFNNNAHVIDLGCGNGVLGLHLLAKNPSLQITFSDESYMAIASAKETITSNLPEQVNQCRFVVNDCLTDENASSADAIICNPPFHQQNATTDHIAWQMFNDCYRVLKTGGKLTIVGNRQLGYHIKLKRIFGNATLVASNKKFVVITAKKK